MKALPDDADVRGLQRLCEQQLAPVCAPVNVSPKNDPSTGVLQARLAELQAELRDASEVRPSSSRSKA